RLLQGRQDLVEDLLVGRLQRVARFAAARGAEEEVVAARLGTALPHGFLEADVGVLVELPPEPPLREVVLDRHAAAAARARAAAAAAAAAAAGRRAAAAGRGARGGRSTGAGGAAGRRARGATTRTATATAAAAAGRDDVAGT